jgi:glycosyltransferase involved in cell wall biosynthesis
MEKAMRICFLCVEIFAWGKYGGFGRATRMIGRELARRGIEVCAIVPRRMDQKPVEELDGIRIYGFELKNFYQALKLYREVDADIYHSEEPSFSTYLAMKMMPARKHVITFRDVRMWDDWKIEFELPSISRAQVIKNWLYEDNPAVWWAVRHAEGLFAASNVVGERAVKKYHLSKPVPLLPTPVMVPDTIEKANRPMVCYVARLDRRKRPELFFELAERFPHVHFISLGISRDPVMEKSLETRYSSIPNLEIGGFVDQFSQGKHSQVLGESWILVNTAAREGLPNSFIEAAAHRCAILSAVNPDNFASEFGYYVQNDDFDTGLNWLLENNRWQECGEKGHTYIQSTYEVESAIKRHMNVYEEILNSPIHSR